MGSRLPPKQPEMPEWDDRRKNMGLRRAANKPFWNFEYVLPFFPSVGLKRPQTSLYGITVPIFRSLRADRLDQTRCSDSACSLSRVS